MGSVHAEIILKNVRDVEFASGGIIKEEDIRSLKVNALVDTGAMSLCITDEIREKLGLKIMESRPVRIANGERIICKIASAVDIYWKNRFTTVRPYVIPGAEIILLGVIPLEDLDLIVNPISKELVGAHGDDWMGMAMTA